jgi:hypothetical protein
MERLEMKYDIHGLEIESLVVIVNLVKGLWMDDQSSIPILGVGHVSVTAVLKVVLYKN